MDQSGRSGLAVSSIPAALPLFAVRLPWSVPFESVFPENAGFVRMLTDEEVDVVVAARRTADPTGESATRFSAGQASYVLAYLEQPRDALVARLGLEAHPVPLDWDARLLPSTATDEADESASDGVGVAMAALGSAPDSGVPPISCTATPALNTFCPYETTTSVTRPAINCTASLVSQLTSGESFYSPSIGGVDYYRTVDLGVTTGPSPRHVWGVRVGRAPDGTVPTVRQLVVLGGQHSDEWEAIEMVRRLIFYYATQYKLGNATVRSLLDQQAILFVPAVNAEGYQFTHDAARSWRENRQLCLPLEAGIDPNRNFAFGWGTDNVGSSPTCGTSFYRGTSAGQASETGIVLNAVTQAGYRSVALLNMHTSGGQVLSEGGFSTGTVSGSSTCTDPSNCRNPDLGLFYRLAGTERAAILRHPAATAVPYVTDQSLHVTYTANGNLDQTMAYGALPGGAPNMHASTIELTSPCRSVDEQTPAALLTQQEADLRALVENHLTQLPTLVGGTTNAFELPVFERRNVLPSVAAEPPTLRLAARNGIAGVAITNTASIAGATSADDVRSGVFYTEYRWRPSGSPWVFPSRSFVCATGQSCRIATLDAPTNVSSLNLCDPSRFVAGSGWSWTGDLAGNTANDCFWTLQQPGAVDATTMLTSTTRDLTHMSQSHLVFSFRRKAGIQNNPPPNASFDVEVSSNNFVGCSMSNYGACRVVRRVGGGPHHSTPNPFYVTVVADVSDFDGQADVRMRIRVWSNDDNTCGDSECRGTETITNCPADCPEPLPRTPRLAVYDPVFVGWYQ